VALERGEHGGHILAAQRHDEDGGEPQVRRHTHLGHGDDMRAEHLVVNLSSGQHLGERVPNELGDSQLAL
jgi:hypothetical protein